MKPTEIKPTFPCHEIYYDLYSKEGKACGGAVLRGPGFDVGGLPFSKRAGRAGVVADGNVLAFGVRTSVFGLGIIVWSGPFFYFSRLSPPSFF